ncbi:hypothetical protein GCM10007897_25250 [Sphingobium jiangsuense]|uniref:Uncharacterized protein (DUF488 family) n=1 Tax=Sphingobium jiangsuense TaxID=870476 RepID=A0A7W6BRA1_9SPHN|nr:DUF488 domain-containing protein [Sphingobium jiangsuense]MBB3928357.1 uncharacterized protein (DUF488 family) [Sphingobium jiangsuense]OJY60866.1 MAG: hypothetical protein BGP16_13140 [Sphingobium sp. 66-54]GLT01134.1 hypothetical protein GCM10007897_25250 [Sphingobium jiangsuense]
MINVLSLGHSNIGWDEFHYALDQFDVGCVIDVRSSPRSRWQHFNKPQLRVRLNRVGIAYVHLGDDLGGIPTSGPTDYAARHRTSAFATGIERVLGIAARCTPALLCSERDPLHCHRFLLISRHLHSLPDVRVAHIRHNGTLECHDAAEERLLALHKLSGDLLSDRSQRLADAYARQERKLG